MRHHVANKDDLVEQVLMAVSTASAALLPERMAAAAGAPEKLALDPTADLKEFAARPVAMFDRMISP